MGVGFSATYNKRLSGRSWPEPTDAGDSTLGLIGSSRPEEPVTNDRYWARQVRPM